VINEPSIMLMDEPTSAMDNTTERTIKRNLATFLRGRTAVVITHRTSMLDLVDRVIVVDKGRIMADGPKDQVVEALRKGRVAKAKA
jgi:ATP-binding cassette subfamily C protein LapB